LFVGELLSVEVGRYGRIVLPKDVREKYQVGEGSRLIVLEREGEIVLVPVKRYAKPTEALYGSIRSEKPIDEPKKVAREHIRRKLVEDVS
jgi:AbrB family looped-hinge helix DNA binding protein